MCVGFHLETHEKTSSAQKRNSQGDGRGQGDQKADCAPNSKQRGTLRANLMTIIKSESSPSQIHGFRCSHRARTVPELRCATPVHSRHALMGRSTRLDLLAPFFPLLLFRLFPESLGTVLNCFLIHCTSDHAGPDPFTLPLREYEMSPHLRRKEIIWKKTCAELVFPFYDF